MSYIYAADVYCDDCAEEICRELRESTRAQCYCSACNYRGPRSEFPEQGSLGAECWLDCPSCGREKSCAVDPYTYDSDDYPKGVPEDGETDCPQHCGACGEPLDYTLTDEGVRYVLEHIRESFHEALRVGRAESWDRIIPKKGTAEETTTYWHGSRHVDIVRGWAEHVQDYELEEEDGALVGLFLDFSEPFPGEGGSK